jgi:hypothetical protein
MAIGGLYIQMGGGKGEGQGPCPGRILSIIGRDPCFSKSNRLHVDIFQNFLY